jgi:hypothetical protein
MLSIQDKSRSFGIREAFIKNRNIGNDFEVGAKGLMHQARSIDLLSVIHSYGIKIDEHSKKITCPFPFHKNEKTASFFYYKNTNSFCCFGCKHGGNAPEFVSLMENISKYDAADRLLKNFQPDNDLIDQVNLDYIDKHKLFIQFSEMIRNFIHTNLDDNRALVYAEKLCRLFDAINNRRKLNVDGVKSLIETLRTELNKFQ